MATLADLIADLLPAARVVWPPGAGLNSAGSIAEGDPAIGWVRVMKARVPAFDALEAGDLALVPASALALVAPDAPQVAAIVALCRRAGVGAILLVEGDDLRSGPDPLDLLEQAVSAAAGPVTVRVPRADVVELERAIIGHLVNRRAELDRQAAGLEADLERLALAGSGPPAMVAVIAAFLGRAVALEDRRGEPLVVHAPTGLGRAAADAAAYQARPRAGQPRTAALRVALPAPDGVSGHLALLGERAAGELDRTVAARIAALMALELTRDADVRQARDAGRRADALPTAGPPWVVALARQRTTSDDQPEPGSGTARARREAVRRDLRQLAPARRLTLRGDADSLELRLVLAGDPGGTGGGRDHDASELAGQIAGLIDRPVAVSRPFDDPSERPAAEAEARATLEAVEALPDPPRLARAARLGAYRLLGGLHHLPDGQRNAQALLAPLIAGRPDVRREHLATLRAVLDHPGTAEAAAALGVHRNTVAYRVRRIESLTGWRLDDPDLRLAVALALRLVQSA